MIYNFVYYQLLEVRMQVSGMVVDRIVSCDFFSRSCLDSHLAHFSHIFEFQHVERADQSDFNFYRHDSTSLLP